MARISEMNRAVTHSRRTLATASSALVKYLKGPAKFTSTEQGSVLVRRCGVNHQVEYVELTDDSGTTLRIEVFVK